MIKLTSIGFSNKKGKKLLFDIPEEMQLKFDYNFGTVREEVLFAGGMILAAPKKEMKLFLTCESETEEKLTLEYLYFKAKGESVLQEFKIPQKMAIPFQKAGTDNQAAEFAGMVFVKIISNAILKPR